MPLNSLGTFSKDRVETIIDNKMIDIPTLK